MKYAILLHPAHQYVYKDKQQFYQTFPQGQAFLMAKTEFEIVSRSFTAIPFNVRQEQISGADYLCFETQEACSDTELSRLARLSFFFVIYGMSSQDQQISFKPLYSSAEMYIDSSISSILKYTGKTNEVFTRLLVNLAISAQDKREHTDLRLLDPISGKGTTLYEGLIQGIHVCGIEIADKVTREAVQFLQRFLQNAKYKYEYKSQRLSGPNQSFKANRHSFELAKTKEAYKSGQRKQVEFIAGNSMYADQMLPKNSIDMIVGDLPYGVQHGNVTNEKQSSLTRNPSRLLETCLPAWNTVLRPGGSLVLAWNQHVLPLDKMVDLVENSGLRVITDPAYRNYLHRVDQSILRNVIVAVKETKST